MLGNYNSDSDNDEPLNKPNSALDAKVEDFLKEIHLISGDSSNNVPSSKSEPQNIQKELMYHPSVTSWQQCYDQNSGYPYYWNTVTNEVTWEMPAELKLALSNVAAKHLQEEQTKQVLQQKQEIKSQPETKKQISKYPWQTESDSEDEKIEMITSFGPQSEEESQESVDKKTRPSKFSSKPNIIEPSNKIKNCITLAPEDPEAVNENLYETSSLLTHRVQDTGPPGDENFQAAENSEKSRKIITLGSKTETLLMSKVTPIDAINVSIKSEPVQNSVSVNSSGSEISTFSSAQEPKIEKDKYNIVDDVIAQIEKETPPDYVVKDSDKKQLELSELTNVNAGKQTSSSTSSSIALLANYGDDSESEDSSFSDKPKKSSRLKIDPSKPLFPIEIPQEKEEKVKPLFPCLEAEESNNSFDLSSKETTQQEQEPNSNLYNAQIDASDAVSRKAFKRKKRLEFATTVYASSSNSSDLKSGISEFVVTAPTTQYNMDPNCNEHRGFGFNVLRSQSEAELPKKTFKNSGGIKFIKAETINLSTAEEETEKSETKNDSSSMYL